MKNTKKLIKMPSIEQFRGVVSNISRQFTYVGDDENGDAIYDYSLPKPTLTFKGTVKLHGTNASVCYNHNNGFWVQSKENIITIEKDNAGFAFFAESHKAIFDDLFRKVKVKNNISLEHNTISIYGEWCGGNIQKKVGIANLPKSFFIFGVKISPIDINLPEDAKPTPAYWVDSDYLRAPDDRIYNIEDYETFSVDVDFNMPQLVQNKFVELTIAVEDECPVAKAFGFPNTIGEGIVWKCTYKDVVYRFKTKGEKHAGSSKVKTIASVDVEKLNSIKDFVDYAVTQGRFNQALENVFPNGEPIDVKKMGEVIRWVVSDIMKEEMDTMIANNIEPKDVNKYISTVVREMFFKLTV
jgi:hypothetical protein